VRFSMSAIIIGNDTWLNEEGTNTAGGWNSGGSVWGSSSGDIFTFANQAWITNVLGSQQLQFDGRGGIDTLDVSASTAGVSVGFSAINFSNLEFILGSSLADKLGGSPAADTLMGYTGADSLWGAAGADLLIGGSDADTYWFSVGDGSDTIADGGSDNKNDAVKFFNLKFSQLAFSRYNSDADVQISINGTDDKVVLPNCGTYMGNNSFDRVNTFITNDVTFGLTIGTSNADSLVGTSLSDCIVGDAGDDTLYGGAGNDAIYGGSGDDLVTYSSSAVWLDGGSGTNTLSAAASSTAASCVLSSSSTIINFTVLEGSSLSDKLGGSSLADTVFGGAGTDSIWGAKGNDLLSGGADSDTYWFGNGDGSDTIASNSANENDYVKFYSAGFGIASTVISGNNLKITMTSGDSLTLLDWKLLLGYQLKNFDGGSQGVWQLSVDADNKATWTKKST